MAAPSTAITRVELSTGFSEFDLAASRRGFVGPSILRPRLVGRQAAEIGNVPIEALLSDRDTSRAPGSGYARSAFTFGTIGYVCNEQGAEEPIDDAQLAIYRDIIDAETVHTGRAIDVVLRRYERAVAAAVYDDTVWTGDLATSLLTAWDVAANATPVDDVKAAMRTVWLRTGLWPNVLLINRRQFDALQMCEQIVDRLQYRGGDGPAVVTRQALAALFGIDQVAVADAARNAANEGQDCEIASIWSDDYAMVARVATSEDMTEPCIGRTFLWSGDGAAGYDASELALIVEEYREEGVRGSVIRARTYYGIKIMLAAAGQLLTGVITSEE
jgi:hypothetical protein